MAKNKKSRILSEAREAAKDLYEVGAIDVATMREFDALGRRGGHIYVGLYWWVDPCCRLIQSRS